MKLSIKVDSTSETIELFIQDSSQTDGRGLTGLVYNSAGLTCYYSFSRTAATAVTLATLAAATSVWSSGGFKEIDATNKPGCYRFDIPNALLASGNGRYVNIYFKGATNMAPVVFEIELTGINNQDTVRAGLTALPNVVSGNAGAVITAGTGTAQLSVTSGATILTPDERNSIATALLDLANGVEGSLTVRQFARLAASVLFGKSDKSGSTRHYRDKADTKDRITATTDGDGQRTAVTVDAT